MTDEQIAAFGRSRDGMSNIMNEIWRERVRQVEAEGYDAAHDDGHPGEMATAAAAYADLAGGAMAGINLAATYNDGFWPPLPESGTVYRVAVPEGWPWGEVAWKPKNPRRDLILAAALIIAEIERMDRAAALAAS